MATPIGHSLIAGLFYFTGKRTHQTDWPLLAVYVLFANGPDLDFLAGLVIGDPGAFHRGISHSFGFAVIFAVATATILAMTGKRFAEYGLPKLMLIGFLLYCSHFLVDLATLDNSAPFGMPLLWPFSGQYVHAPIYIFPNVLHGGGEFSLHNLSVALREVVVFAPPMLYLMLINQRFLTPVTRLWGLALTAYVGIVLALLTSSNPYF